LFNHEKQIAGHPSIGNISSGGQALEYAAQKFAATPTTGRYVAKNYANVLNDIGHCITGGLDEDEGKRTHQTEAKDEKRYGNMANYEKKARSMSQYGQMEKNLKVAAKKEELKAKMKRIFRNPRKSAEDWRTETKEVHDEAREASLNDGFPMLEGCTETLRDHNKARKEDTGRSL
jgi:hypothetical protein